MKDFFSKSDQIHRKLQIWSDLLKKSLMENFIFCALSLAHQARTLTTNLLGLISTFSKYYFKTGTIFLLFLSSYVFTALAI